MRNTKEKNIVQKTVTKLVGLVFTVIICLIGTNGSANYAEASSFVVNNYITMDRYTYTGTEVTYEVNGKKLTTPNPGLILQNGSAVGPLKEIFVDTIGVISDYTDGKNTFTVTYGTTTVKMTLGNTEAVVNGKKQTMQNAPYLYSFQDSDKKQVYVPTRFLAECFGFEYTWNSTTAVASIQQPNYIYDGTQKVNYTGDFPKFYLDNSNVSNELYPGYIFDELAFFAAEEFFKNTKLASYYYDEGSGLIWLKNGENTVRLVVDSPIAYCNDTPYLMETVPRLITPNTSAKATIYVPGQFVAEALGYKVSYKKGTTRLYVTGGSADSFGEEEVPLSPDAILDTASYGAELFSYDITEKDSDSAKNEALSALSKVAAYSCVNSDALYLKGIDAEKISIVDKSDIIEIHFSGYQNPVGGKLFYNPDASFLNYCYFSTADTLKILIIKRKDLQYYTYEAPNGCVIHFTDSVGMYQDSLRFMDPSGGLDTEDTDILSKEESAAQLPEATFSRNQFVIPLPDGLKPTSIVDTDEYYKNRFMLAIPGNHLAFLTEQPVYNPVSTLKNVQFNYKAADNTTVLTFNTTKIQGYSFTVKDGFLAVTVANPSEVYEKIIVLDAGHGGIDPGTSRNNVLEKNVNFNVTNKYAVEYFKDSDIKVYYTRTTDTKISLQERAAFAQKVDADLFISFHVNANNSSSVQGTSVYYSSANNKASASGLKSSVLATSIAKHLSNAWGTRNRGILSEKFVVVHSNTVPAVLVECGFITNNSDFAKIKDASYQKKAAKALYDAVTEIFEQYPTKR